MVIFIRRPLLLFSFLLLWYAPGASAASALRSRRFSRYISRLFHESADVNKDGTISFDECYQSLLIFYTYLNQLAPIPPPKRARVQELYASADWDARAGLQEAEFQLLAGTLASRATLRLGLYKAVTWVVAPLLSSFLLNQAEGTAWVESCYKAIQQREWIPSIVSTRSFWMTVVLVANVSNLGMLVLWLLDEVLLTRFKPMQKLWIPEKLEIANSEEL